MAPKKKNKKAKKSGQGNSEETDGKKKKPKVKLLGSMEEIHEALEKSPDIGPRLTSAREELKDLRKKAVADRRLFESKSKIVSKEDVERIEKAVDEKKEQVKTLSDKLALPKRSFLAIRRKEALTDWAVLTGEDIEDEEENEGQDEETEEEAA